MSERGMKKWLPFNALVEQNEFLEKMLYEKYKIKKPQVSIEQARRIDRILKEYRNNELTFKIYVDGYLYTFKGTIKEIDLQNKQIYFNDFVVPIKNIIDIESPDIFEDIC